MYDAMRKTAMYVASTATSIHRLARAAASSSYTSDCGLRANSALASEEKRAVGDTSCMLLTTWLYLVKYSWSWRGKPCARELPLAGELGERHVARGGWRIYPLTLKALGQSWARGHSPHSGFLALHTSLPSFISRRWASSLASSLKTRCSASLTLL